MSLMGKKIALVEDEEGLILTVSDRLNAEGAEVVSYNRGDKAYDALLESTVDVIILDLMLPGKDGLSICRDLRSKGVYTPIIMLTAKGEVFDKVLGLKMGANDYIAKPFDMQELMARVEVQIRPFSHYSDSDITVDSIDIGEFHIDFIKKEINGTESNLEFSAKEWQLLAFLVKNQGKVISRDELLHEVWGYESVPSSRTVDVHVAWLRQKLEKDSRYPEYIQTVHGMGYKFVYK